MERRTGVSSARASETESTQRRRDAVWERASEIIGGPRGEHAGRATGALAWFTPARVLILLTAVSAIIAYLIKLPCFPINWSSPGAFSRACYSDWPVIFTGRGLADGSFPFLTAGPYVEYPVLLGLFAGLTGWAVPGTGMDAGRTVVFFEINAVLAAIAWGALVLVTMATARRIRASGAYQGTTAHRPGWAPDLERAAAVALSPAIITTIFINWDIYAVLLAALALWAIVARKWALAGVFIALGTAFKLYPILLLGVVFLRALRSPKNPSGWRAFLVTSVTAAGVWLAVNLPFMLKDFAAWKYFLDFSRDREAGFSSVWFVYNMVALKVNVPQLTPEQINVIGMICLLAMLALIVLFSLAAPVRVPPAELAFLIVAAFVLTNKVYSPQFVIWLVPLAVLAGISWRVLIAWQLVEVLHWWATWEVLARWAEKDNAQHALPEKIYMLAVGAHVLAVLWIMGIIVLRQMAKPRADRAP